MKIARRRLTIVEQVRAFVLLSQCQAELARELSGAFAARARRVNAAPRQASPAAKSRRVQGS